MSTTRDALRVLMYSHDTYGLGHLTRTIRIARAIQECYDHISILVLSGSSVAPYIPLPPRTDLVKLPSVLKSGADTYEARELEVDFRRIRAMRREMIRGTAATFRPHLFLVDNTPVGMKGEILPTLELLRRQGKARIALNLRDVLDDPETIRARWREDDVFVALDRFYDRIFVLGDSEVFNSVAAYDLPADRTEFLGYVTPTRRRVLEEHPTDKSRPCSGPRILLTAGGGGDGVEFLTEATEGIFRRTRASGEGALGPVQIEVITGPLMEAAGRQRLRKIGSNGRAEVSDFVPDLPGRMAQADLVVAMAGYNTCCEVLSHARYAILYPRITPRVEQLIRAHAFAERGLACLVEPEHPIGDRVGELVADALRQHHRISHANLPRIGGQHRLAARLRDLLPQLEKASSKEGPTPGAFGELGSGSEAPSLGSTSNSSSFFYWPAAFRPEGIE